MTLKEKTLFEKIDKIQIAIERLKTFEPVEGYYLVFSGGKDSIVIKKLADMAKIKYDAHYNDTTIDPPELREFIKNFHPDVIIDRPEKSFYQLMIKRGFPIRQSRWCCEVLKERGGAGRKVITGIQWAESSKRAKRKSVEHCFKDKRKIYINPIIDWSDSDVWDFIKKYNLPYCKLYDEGWKRIGCLFCPMATKRRLIEIELYPKFKRAFILAFEKLYRARKAKGAKSIQRWNSGKEMFEWWINENRESEQPDQGVMFE